MNMPFDVIQIKKKIPGGPLFTGGIKTELKHI